MSVDSTSVRWPALAQASAVAAATLVFPTPPLPVYSRMRLIGRESGAIRVPMPGAGLRSVPDRYEDRDDQQAQQVVGTRDEEPGQRRLLVRVEYRVVGVDDQRVSDAHHQAQ